MLRSYTVLQPDMERTPDGRTYDARTYADAWRHLAGLLSVDGPRCLLAVTDDGAEVRASLYDDEDYIIGAGGQNLPLP